MKEKDTTEENYFLTMPGDSTLAGYYDWERDVGVLFADIWDDKQGQSPAAESSETLVELCANVIRLGEKLQELAQEQRADSEQWEKWWAKVNATRLERLRQEENEDA